LGWTNNETPILQRISSNETYQQLFQKAFPSEETLFTTKNVQQAITSFVKTIFSFQSNNDRGKLSEKEKKGWDLFQSAQLKCARCHSGINFNRPVFQSTPYFNTGFFTDTAVHKGLYAFTGNKKDAGAYKVPTLRNLAFTAPYLHNGSIETLEQVIQLYEQGGYPAVQNKHPLITGFKLNSQQRSELIAFLLSLSDSSVLQNPAYTNPWKIK
jgi:cytochrome c peroxidase